MKNSISQPTWLEAVVPDVAIDASSSTQRYRIGDLAKEFDVTLRTLRFYEDRGLITPERSGSQRLYSESDRTRLKLILLAKQIGFSLVDIEHIMKLHDNIASDETGADELLKMFRDQRAVLAVQQSELNEAVIRLEETIQALEG